MSKLKSFFHKWLPTPQKKRENFEEMIQEDSAALDPEEQHLLSNILNLRAASARDIMTPRAEMVGIQKTKNIDDIRHIIVQSPFTRFPIYGETLDQIEGYIQGKFLCQFMSDPEHFSLQTIMKKVLFISPSMGLIDLLLQMKATQIPMAIVVDEYGATDGMVTVWDVVSEIIGDLANFHTNIEKPGLTKVSDQQYLADGKCPMKDIETALGSIMTAEEEEEDIETIGGLIMHTIGRVPARREIIRHSSGLSCEVLDADSRRVKQVRLWLKSSPSESK